MLDGVIAVIAPNELRIKRVLKRPGMTEELIKDRMSRQLPTESLVDKANWLINNDETVLVIPQVLKVHEEILMMC